MRCRRCLLPQQVPGFVSVVVAPDDATLAKGERTGLKAIAIFDNGGLMDLTTLLDWYSVNPAIAKVSGAGIVTAVKSGKTKIVAVGLGGAIVSEPFTVTVP